MKCHVNFPCTNYCNSYFENDLMELQGYIQYIFYFKTTIFAIVNLTSRKYHHYHLLFMLGY